MGTRANNDVTAGARSIMQYCKSLQVKSGITATEFAAECGFSRNYWFVRARFDAPLTISDCERRCRRETALALISPVDYGMAETVYEGNTWMMAVELGVTIQVLNDYRQLLYDSGVCVQ